MIIATTQKLEVTSYEKKRITSILLVMVYLCSDFASKPGYDEDMDKKINDMAYESLLELAQTATEENYELIVQTVIKLYDKYGMDSKVVEKLLYAYDIEQLTCCLVSWKGVANTKLPRYY